MISMKKLFSLLCFALLACGTMYADLSGKKIYIDPGHGTYGSDDRLMDCIGIPLTAVKDGYGFSESHTNLWKAEALQKKLVAAGAQVKMSRTVNNVSPELSVRATEAMNFGSDYFISIHSNAHIEGYTTNYPALFYKGKEDGTYVNSDSKYRAQVLWPYLFEVFSGSTAAKFEPNTSYESSMCIRADVDFMGGPYTTTINGVTYYGYYGVLRHGIPGYLSEGFFHTYQPGRHRALNQDYCRQEGVRYYRGLAAYYGHANESVGYIMGVVKDGQQYMTQSSTLSATSWNYQSGTHDQYRPINGAKVTLYNSNQEKVGEYTCDNYYNGVFVFNDLTPGTYTLDVYAPGYANVPIDQRTVVVSAHKTTYPIVKLSAGVYVPDEELGRVDSYEFTKKSEQELAISGTIKRTIAVGNSTVILSHDADGTPHLYLYNHTEGKLSSLSLTGIGSVDASNPGSYLSLSDIAMTDDGKLIGCNLIETQWSDTEVGNATATKRGTLQFYKWDSLTGNPSKWVSTQTAARWYNALAGKTFAVKGTSTNCSILFPVPTVGTSKSFRVSKLTVNNGTIAEANNGLGGSLNMKLQLQSETDLTEIVLGEPYLVTSSPFGGWVLDGSLMTPFEVGETAEIGVMPVNGTIPDAIYGVEPHAINFGHFKNRYWSICPYVNSSKQIAGVRLCTLDAGLSSAMPVATGSDLETPLTATFSSASMFLQEDSVMNIYLFADKKLITFSADVSTPEPEPEIRVTPESLSFEGFEGNEIEAQEVTVKGIALTATPAVSSATYFDVTTDLTEKGGTLTIAPKSGLAIGSYTETLTISLDTLSAEAALEVTIEEKPIEPEVRDSARGIFAYDLNVTRDGTNYTFTFKANDDAWAAKLVLYKDGVQAGDKIDLGTVYAGANSVTIASKEFPGEIGDTYTWAIELTGYKIDAWKSLFKETDYTYTRAFNVVDNSPESDYFGQIYVMDRAVYNGTANGLFIYDQTWSKQNTTCYNGGKTWASPARLSIDEHGTLYCADWGNEHAGVYVGNPANLSGTWGDSFVTTALTASPACYVYGKGKDTKLLVAQGGTVHHVYIYNIGNADGSLKTSWSGNPTKDHPLYINTSAQTGDLMLNGDLNIKATSHGYFVAQTRYTGNNATSCPSFVFVDWDGNILYNSGDHTDIITGSYGSGLAVSADESQMILHNGDSQFVVYDITWNGNTPSLSVKDTYTNDMTDVRQISLDYAGNVIATGASGMQIFARPTNDNRTTVPAKKALTVIKFEAIQTLYDELSPECVYYSNGMIHNPQGLALQVFNISGQLVATGSENIDMTTAASGVYIVKSNAGTLKLVK